jgi:CheY-like chemotaxis protein
VKEAVEICRPDFAAKGVELVTELTASRDAVMADAGRMHQILWNLLKNAVKFTPTGGRVTIRTRQDSLEKIVVSVSDSGVGIPQERLGKIFDAFDQGNSDLAKRLGGLGLGLAISRALVTAHGGEIRVSSAGDGQGSTFEILLKTCASLSTLPNSPTAPGEANAAPAGSRILLVEDHVDSAEALARALRRRGYEVQHANSVANGLETFRDNPFDLIVCDIGLPDGTGIDLMTHLTPNHQVKAIALSGFGMDHDLKRSEEAGFSAHLTKPVDFPRLLATIQRVLVEG